MTNECRSRKSETEQRASSFGFRISFVIRTSSFSESGPFHKAADDLLRREMFRRNIRSGAAVAGVVGFDGVHGSENIVHRLEAKQTFAARQEFAEAGFLRDDG